MTPSGLVIERQGALRPMKSLTGGTHLSFSHFTNWAQPAPPIALAKTLEQSGCVRLHHFLEGRRLLEWAQLRRRT